MSEASRAIASIAERSKWIANTKAPKPPLVCVVTSDTTWPQIPPGAKRVASEQEASVGQHFIYIHLGGGVSDNCRPFAIALRTPSGKVQTGGFFGNIKSAVTRAAMLTAGIKPQR